MQTASSEIREQIENMWPVLAPVVLFDKNFWKPPLYDLERLFKESRIHTMKFIKEFNDCDNYSLQFHAEIRRKRYFAWERGRLPDKQMFPVPVGSVFGYAFRGVQKLHFVNLCVCQEGIYLFDLTPSENRFWKADPEQDDIRWISMQ